MKRYSTPTDNREMHIKMSIGHHTLSIMGKVKKLIIPMVGNVGKWPLCLQMRCSDLDTLLVRIKMGWPQRKEGEWSERVITDQREL